MEGDIKTIDREGMEKYWEFCVVWSEVLEGSVIINQRVLIGTCIRGRTNLLKVRNHRRDHYRNRYGRYGYHSDRIWWAFLHLSPFHRYSRLHRVHRLLRRTFLPNRILRRHRFAASYILPWFVSNDRLDFRSLIGKHLLHCSRELRFPRTPSGTWDINWWPLPTEQCNRDRTHESRKSIRKYYRQACQGK